MDPKFISTREITMKEVMDRLEKPLITVAFECEFDDEDFSMEDTILVPIAMPKAAWKLLYGTAKSAGISVGDAASEWLCDTAMDMVQNMKPMRNETAREEAEKWESQQES